MLIAAAALAGCTGKKTADVQQETRVLTKTETAESATVQLTEEFTSEIEPFRENDITPAASGVHIDRIYVEVGDPVREGQLVVTLDPTQYTQQLVQLKTVEDDYNRLLPVYEAGGISTQQIEQAKAQLDEGWQQYNEGLAQYEAGEHTEDAFAAIGDAARDDGTAAESARYEDITPGQMVEDFENWCFEDHEVGDTGIIESSYGYHVMYFSGYGTNYRMKLVEDQLRSDAYDAWFSSVTEGATDNIQTNAFGMRFTTK